MRILQVIHDFVPETKAGAEINTHKLSVDLQQRHGHELFVFCRGWNLEAEPYTERNEQLDGLQVRRIELGRNNLPNRWRRHDPRVDNALRRMIEQTQPDLMHIQHFIYLSTNIVAVAKEYGLPVVVSLRNFWFRCPWGTLLDHEDKLCQRRAGVDCLSCHWPDRLGRRRNVIPWRVLNPIQIQFYEHLGARPPLPAQVREMLPSFDSWEREFREALLLADHLHSPSEFLKQLLVEFGIPAEHTSVISNGFRYDPEQVQRKQRGQRIRFGMIGMHHLKGLHLAIEAFRGLDQDRAELVVYGQEASPRYVNKQKARAQGYNIRFAGTYEQSAIYEVFRDIDVLLVPSIWYENCPTVIREAFATNTPVITADIGGMAESVHHQQNGLLFRANNAQSLQEQMQAILDNPALIDQFAQQIEAPITVQQCTDGILEIYQQVLERAGVCTA
jgi:glycosyltransferase involved in cell wall biosynthesis